MKKQNKINGNILILTHWSYNDALVQTYTLPYVKIIRRILPMTKRITLVTSEQPLLALTKMQLQGINNTWASENMNVIAMPYEPMGIRKVLKLLLNIYQLFRIIKNENIKRIHCFCTPAGSIGYVLSKLTGAELIIDSYEPHAESMVENGTWSKYGLPFRLLFFMEKFQTRHARYIIGTTRGMRTYAKEKYSTELHNFFVKPACVDLQKFSYSNRDSNLSFELGLKDKIVCVYAGKLGGIYLKAEVFDFLRICYDYWGDRFRFLMLTNATKKEVAEEMLRSCLPTELLVQTFVKHEEVPRYLAIADFAINPVRPVSTKQYCTSIKDSEYWATGLPVVITKNISDDSEIISKNNVGYTLSELNDAEYRRAVERIESLIHENANSGRNKIREIAVKYRSFHVAENIYTTIYS